MKHLIRKVALSCLVLMCLLLSPALRTTVFAGEVLTAEELKEPKLNVTSLLMVTDDKFTIRVYNLTETQTATFKTDDAEIASVTAAGRVTAGKVGETIITVTVKDSDTDALATFKCSVSVGPPALSVRLTLNTLTLEVGKRKTLQTILKPNTTTEIAVYRSTNPEVATVSATGKVIAKSVGTTLIIAEIANGRYDVCEVTVEEAAITEEVIIDNALPAIPVTPAAPVITEEIIPAIPQNVSPLPILDPVQ